jgi:integrase
MNSLSPIKITKDQIRAVFESRDLAESTIKEYSRKVIPFIVYSENNGLNLMNYKRELAKRTDIADSTKQGYLASAKVFLTQLNKKGKIPDIASDVKLFKESKGHKRDGLSADDVKKIVAYMAQLEPSPETARFKALFCLEYYQGLRNVEIYRLKISDLNLNEGTALVERKGQQNKELIFLHPNTVKSLKLYLGYVGVKSGAVFVSFSTNDSKGKSLSQKSLYNIIADVLKELGIARKDIPGKRYNKSPHGFRHRYTTKLLDILNDPLKVMQFTGHRSVETIRKYDDRRIHKQDLKVVFEEFNKI